MRFRTDLIHGRLIRRYKRFLADILLDDGRVVTAHCTNSGSMKSCLEDGAEVWLSPSDRVGRKTPFTWEMIWINDDWVGVNTSNPNLLAMEWILERWIPGLENLEHLRREVKWEDSRLDIYAEGPGGPCFIEVKNVTLREGDVALFPDAVTERGRKHLETLARIRHAGMRAVMLYVVQRTDVHLFSAAREIDPAYAASLEEAVRRGVEIMVAQARVTPQGIGFHRMLPVKL